MSLSDEEIESTVDVQIHSDPMLALFPLPWSLTG